MSEFEVVEVVVTASSEAMETAARHLADETGLPFARDSSAPIQLQLTPEHLQLVEIADDAPGPVFVDFLGGAVGHRHQFGGGRGQTIAKAVGLKGGNNPSVVDATAGLGRDAFVLASLGCQVTMVERSAVVAALLADGLKRAAADAELGQWIGQRMRLVQNDAIGWMNELDKCDFPDVVYLDPMFPHRQKSALVKKEMRLFQKLLGFDEMAGELLSAALRIAKKRVVVKRPDHAPCLSERKPTMQIKGKKHRFDVYVKAAL
ncbi:MAG: class I SAM-dependent methyltransferase [Pseudomonadota bacterium]